MSENRHSIQTGGEPYLIVRERLCDSSTDFTSFFFHRGANVYVLSYTKGDARKHTFIDTGDSRYRDIILPLLTKIDIEPAGIERIIITHRHPDHIGMADLLAGQSGASIMAHENFRSFVEGAINQDERHWLGGLNPSHLQECNMEYLSPDSGLGPVKINGMDFPSLVAPIQLGEGGYLQILACPESEQMHTPDQVVVLYSPSAVIGNSEDSTSSLRPADRIIFSGDLWLMRGPMFYGGMRDFSIQMKYGMRQLKGALSGKGIFRRDPREQDARAKDALKRGFSLIRVAPGHGEEFLGSRLLPGSVLADRDLLLELGYSMDANTSILKSAELAPKIAALKEQAYATFVRELSLWKELGYAADEVREMLVRIYREQSGGGPLVQQDRKQRRERLKRILARLGGDENAAADMRQIAATTLSSLEKVS